MDTKAKELAEFIRTIGLNGKFKEDRRKEVRVFASNSQSSVLQGFQHQEQGGFSHADIKQFLNRKRISWTDEDFEALLLEINPTGLLEITPAQLSSFMGLTERTQKGSSSPDESLNAQIVRLFQQVISSHRRIDPLREKLKGYGETIELYRLLDDKGSGAVPASRLIEFFLSHSPIDTETLGYLFKQIEKKGGLTFQLLNWWLEPVGLRRLCIGQFSQGQGKKRAERRASGDQIIEDRDYSYIEDLRSVGSGHWKAPLLKGNQQLSALNQSKQEVSQARQTKPKHQSTLARFSSPYCNPYSAEVTSPIARLLTPSTPPGKAPPTPEKASTSRTSEPMNSSVPISDRCWNLERELGKTQEKIHNLRTFLDQSNTMRNQSKSTYLPEKVFVLQGPPRLIQTPFKPTMIRQSNPTRVLVIRPQQPALMRTGSFR